MVIEILDNVKRGEIHLACSLYRLKILCTAIANFSSSVNELSSGSPSRIRIVLLISFGITTLPRLSILLTIPVAFMLLFHAFPVRSFAESCFLKTSLPEPNAQRFKICKIPALLLFTPGKFLCALSCLFSFFSILSTLFCHSFDNSPLYFLFFSAYAGIIRHLVL